jgi:hypothetical protein
MTDIVDDLKDLLKQATTERSHYYVAECCRRAIAEIESLRKSWLGDVGRILAMAQDTNKVVKDANERLDRAGIP